MEYFLLLLSIVLLIFGIVGSILPALPGLPISWLGFLSLYLVKDIQMNPTILWITLIITIAITVLDYVIPAQGTKRFGGSKYGVWGTNIGLVVGLFIPPIGFILGPFIGAFIGEIIYEPTKVDRAFKAAIGSFLGFLASTFIKIVTSLFFLGIGIYVIIKNSGIWF
ncbi:DUF456 domain-containing protein [Myroides sp. LJL116]